MFTYTFPVKEKVLLACAWTARLHAPVTSTRHRVHTDNLDTFAVDFFRSVLTRDCYEMLHFGCYAGWFVSKEMKKNKKKTHDVNAPDV